MRTKRRAGGTRRPRLLQVALAAGLVIGSMGTLPLTSALPGSTVHAQTAAVAAPPVSLGPITARIYTNPGDFGGFIPANPLPNPTPLFTQEFSTIFFNASQSDQSICSPKLESVNEFTRPFTAIAPQPDGSCIGVPVAGNGYEAGNGDLHAFYMVFTADLTVASAGEVTFNVRSDDGWNLAIGSANGSQPTYASGELFNPLLSGPLTGYPVVGAFNGPTSPTLRYVTINFPAAGTYPIELDYSECCGGELTFILGTTFATPVPPSGDIGGFDELVAASFGDGRTGVASEDPVNSLSGNFVLATTDLALPSRGGLPLAMTRTYNSRDTRVGLFGPGWSSSLETSVQEVPQGALLSQPDGRRDLFRTQADGSFAPPVGDFDTLTRTASGWELLTHDQLRLTFDNVGRLLQTRDRNDNALTFERSGDHVSALVDGGGRGLHFTYDAAGRLTETRDAAGRVVAYGYDSQARLTSVRDASGGLTRFEYGSTGAKALEKVTNPLGNVAVANTYDADGRVTRQLNAMGAPTAFSYDTVAARTTITDARGAVTVIAHSADGLVGSITDASGHSVTYGNDARGNLTSFLDRNGTTWEFSSDAHGNRTDVTDAAGAHATFSYDARNNLTSRTDPTGSSWRYTYDSRGNLTEAIDPNGGVIRLVVDAFGQPTRITDPDGVATAYTYDAAGNVLTVTTAAGVTRNEYDAAGRLTRATDANGHVSVFSYDGAGRLLSATDALAKTATLSYDAAGNLVTLKDRVGASTAFRYDAASRLTALVDALNQTTAFTYDANGNRTGVTDAAGKTLQLAYNELDRLSGIIDPEGGRAELGYDPNGNLTSTIDPRGAGATRTYDFRNLLSSATDRTGALSRLAYDGAGRLTMSTDALGAATAFGYDPAGRLTSITDALGHTTRTAYTPASRIASESDANGNTTAYAYDAAGRLIRTTDAAAGTTTRTYDAASNLLTLTDQLRHTTTYRYDAADRLIALVDALGNASAFSYDANGALTAAVDAAGNRTGYTYDALGRLTTVTDALGGRTNSAYDPRGLLTALTDANGHTSTYVYDGNRRLTQETDALGRRRAYAYDAAGNATAITDALGQQTALTYDGENRLASVTYADGASVSYGRDARGDRVQMVDSLGTTSYVYNALRELVSLSDPFGKTVSYQYDPAGSRSSLTYPDGRVADYGYDTLNRLTSVSFRGSGVPAGAAPADGHSEGTNRYSYDAASNPTSASFANGTRMEAMYDALNRISALTNRDAAGKAASAFTYGYDKLGNITREQSSGAQSLASTRSYAYDALSRLTSVTDDRAQTAYKYDAVGNRISVSSNGGKDTLTSAFDAANELISSSRAGATAATYTYDANGALTSRKTGDTTTRYAWNAAGRLVSVTDATSALAYAYDGDGNLLKETRTGDNPGSLSYTLDLAGPLAQVLTASDGHSQTDFLYGLRRIAAFGEQTRYYGADARGSVRSLTDERGRVTTTSSYDAWGKPKDASPSNSPLANLFGFTGERQDVSSGLVYLRARWYAPELGQFLSRDPLRGLASAPRTLAPYTYAFANPISFVDRSGLSPNRGLLDGDAGYSYDGRALYGLKAGSSTRASAFAAGIAKHVRDFASSFLRNASNAVVGAVQHQIRAWAFGANSRETKSVLNPEVTIEHNATGVVGDIVKAIGGSDNTTTFGAKLVVSRVDVPARSKLEKHEVLGHTAQAAEKGIWYLPSYVLEQAWNWTVYKVTNPKLLEDDPGFLHRIHSMEIDADIRGGVNIR